MAKDITDVMRDTLAHAARDVAKNVSPETLAHVARDAAKNVNPEALGKAARGAAKSVGRNGKGKSSRNPLSGAGGVAAGAGIGVLAPVAAGGAVKLVRRRLAGQAAKRAGGDAARVTGDGAGVVDKATSKLGDAVGKGVGGKVKESVAEAGGVGGVAKEVGKSVLPSIGGGGGGGQQGAPGVGKGRRMPVQQSIDVAVPIETAYNQFTQFEDWPTFMHRVTSVSQDEPTSVSFTAKIWTVSREFEATIETQRPDERIKWRVEQGISHTGVVTFHELAPRLTRIELTVDVDPGSLLEKAARGMRHIKRAMRADLHRYKAYIEMQENETGAWRGVIEDGEVVEDHDPAYDEERDYAAADDERMDAADEEQPEDEEPEEEEPEAAAEEDEEPEDEEPEAAAEEDEEPEEEEPEAAAEEDEEPEEEEPEAAAEEDEEPEPARSSGNGGEPPRPTRRRAQRPRPRAAASRSSGRGARPSGGRRARRATPAGRR